MDKIESIKNEDLTQDQVSINYSLGNKFNRIAKGNFSKDNVVRINLSKFSISSENRRILNKFNQVEITIESIPLEKYNWAIPKLYHDFYFNKFGKKIFSVNRVKDILNGSLNFNSLLNFSFQGQIYGYCIIYINSELIHYSYPVYNLELINTNFGIYMLTKSIIWAKENGLKYIYLGGYSKYKLQFKGVEVFQNNIWV